MRITNYTKCFTVIFILLIVAVAFSEPVFQKGMSYTPWQKNVLLTSKSDQSIHNMAAIGIEWVALTVFWFQDDRHSTVISPDFSLYSASSESVSHAIQEIHRNGMKVLLKPHVDMRTGEWRARIQPSQEWFKAYESYIVDWAVFAEENHADMLSIGCELVDATKRSTWRPYWRDIIQKIRQVYSGPLTYAADYSNETQITWWDALDYIGIDAYYPLSSKTDPTLDELMTAWDKWAEKIQRWRNRFWPTLPVIFTEIGYRSFDGANREPWEYAKNDPQKVDLQEQADAYQAALSVLTKRNWFYGFYWWQWDTDPLSGGKNHTGFTIQNKPAQDLLADWYQNRLQSGRFIPSHVPLFPHLR